MGAVGLSLTLGRGGGVGGGYALIPLCLGGVAGLGTPFTGDSGERLDAHGRRTAFVGGDPLPLLREEVLGAGTYVDPGLPPLVGGAVGDLGYEMVRQWEPRVPHTPGS